MTTRSLEITPKSFGRTAGALYLAIAVFGVFSIGYVPSVIIQTHDAGATAQNILAYKALYNMGLFGDVVVLLLEVILTAMLYVMFKPVSATLALVAAWSRIAMTMVMGVNLLFNILPVFLLSGADSLSGIPPQSLQSGVMILLRAHDYGIYIWQLFFALHLLAVGYMIVHSNLFPHVLGRLMAVGSFGYSLQALQKIMHIESTVLSVAVFALLVLVTVGELAFAFWLLIKGARPKAGGLA